MKNIDENTTLLEYFKLWIKLYKVGAVREVTLKNTGKHITLLKITFQI